MGGVLALEAGMPGLRAGSPGRVASGRGWIGYTPRGAYNVENLRAAPLAPAWLMLLIAAALAIAWLTHQGDHVIPIPGTRSVQHVRESMAGADIDLSAADLARIEAVL